MEGVYPQTELTHAQQSEMHEMHTSVKNLTQAVEGLKKARG